MWTLLWIEITKCNKRNYKDRHVSVFQSVTIVFAWKVFAAFGAILLRIYRYSVRMRENTDQNNSVYRHFSCSETDKTHWYWIKKCDKMDWKVWSGGLLITMDIMKFDRITKCDGIMSLHKKWSFQLKISSVNAKKSAVSCGFGHIYRRNL